MSSYYSLVFNLKGASYASTAYNIHNKNYVKEDYCTDMLKGRQRRWSVESLRDESGIN